MLKWEPPLGEASQEARARGMRRLFDKGTLHLFVILTARRVQLMPRHASGLLKSESKCDSRTLPRKSEFWADRTVPIPELDTKF